MLGDSTIGRTCTDSLATAIADTAMQNKLVVWKSKCTVNVNITVRTLLVVSTSCAAHSLSAWHFEAMANEVKLYVYDLSMGAAKSLSTALIGKQIGKRNMSYPIIPRNFRWMRFSLNLTRSPQMEFGTPESACLVSSIFLGVESKPCPIRKL